MRALALVEAPEHVCCRYRIRAFGDALARDGWALTIEGIAGGFGARLRQLRSAARYDAVVLQRKLLAPWEFGVLRRSARRLVFDLDDAVFWRDSYHPRGHRSGRRMGRFVRVAREADAILAGNDFLAARAILAGASPGAVRRLPTCIDPGRYRAKEHGPSDRFRLAWIGSSSTLRGLEACRPLWARVARSVPGVLFRVICDRAPDLGPMPVEFVRWSEATEAEAIAGADVGIAWTPDDLWSRGKCGLKLLQYQAAGLPVVANPVGVHGEMVVPGVSGDLARTEDEWVRALAALAESVALRQRMGHAAREGVERHYAVSRWSAAFVEALGGDRLAAETRATYRPMAFNRTAMSAARNGGGHP